MSRASMADEEIEYESDPEEAKLSLKMRRRQASDDEAEEGVEIRANPLRGVEIDDSDGESEGAAAEYDDEYEDDEDNELDEFAEEMVEEVKRVAVVERADAERDGEVEEEFIEQETRVINDDAGKAYEGNIDTEDGQAEEKKEIEPFSVPTAGAFYMHDDRFRDSARGRNRRMIGGKKLWESKDDRKWGHDKFEELTVQDRGSEEHRRGSRGRNRGRGRSRAAVREYAQVNRPRELTNSGTQNNDNDSQNSAPKGFRGRGPRRYQPLSKTKAPFTQNKHSGKSNEKPSYVSYERISESMSNVESGVALPRIQAFASSLNIASPPFYPSASSTKDYPGPNKRDVQAGSTKDGAFGKPASTVQMPPSGPSSVNSTHQQFRGQGRGIMGSSTQMVYQPVVSNNNQVNRVNPSNKLQTGQSNPGHGQSNPGQSRGQSFVQASVQQFTQRVPSGSITSSPPKATGAVNAVESGELETPPESNKSKNALVSKGKGSIQGNGRGSFLYGGNMGSGHGDPNYPAFLPVMQFGGQHPGGMGVPAVGMAFPGYVGQPQHGRGTSEMTWLPVLTGPAGALGARNWPPYLAVDGSFHARPSGQMSSVTAASSKENDSINVGNEWTPGERSEPSKADLGQRQKDPRRQIY
ncbi:hypothetical protein CASFOL_038654 [Castilleja foliolosa]|uniref:Btz domain-containing protein n=1 Tax=Castilleja foliolosa TaxID=1961234 RepID=A0ABD3BMC4_9LAMI